MPINRSPSQDSFGLGPEGEEQPLVDLKFSEFGTVAEATAALARTVSAIEQGGLDFTRLEDRGGTVQLEMAAVRIDAPYLGNNDPDRPRIFIRVIFGVEDAEAREALQPLVDALGTIG